MNVSLEVYIKHQADASHLLSLLRWNSIGFAFCLTPSTRAHGSFWSADTQKKLKIESKQTVYLYISILGPLLLTTIQPRVCMHSHNTVNAVADMGHFPGFAQLVNHKLATWTAVGHMKMPPTHPSNVKQAHHTVFMSVPVTGYKGGTPSWCLRPPQFLYTSLSLVFKQHAPSRDSNLDLI